LTEFPDVEDAAEVEAVATAADDSKLTFAVVSAVKAAGVTTVVLTSSAGYAGKAAGHTRNPNS